MRPLTLLLGCLLISTPLLAQLPSYVPTDGLVAWYPLNGGCSDLGPNLHDGTANNIGYSSDRFGQSDQSAHLNGSNAFIGLNFPSVSNTLNALTINAWVKTTDAHGPVCALRAANGGHTLEFNIGTQADIIQNPGHIGSLVRNSCCGAGNNFFGSQVNDNQWHMVTLIRQSNGALRIYDNAVLTNQTGASNGGALQFANQYMALGSEQLWDNSPSSCGSCNSPHQRYLEGQLDDVGFWSRELSAAELSALYSAPASSTSGCMDSAACNYDSEANLDDGSCIPSGCMEEGACNYNAAAECEGEACDYSCCPGPGCCVDPNLWDGTLQQCTGPEAICGAGTTWDPVTETCIVDTPGDELDEDCSFFGLQELVQAHAVALEHIDLQDSLLLALQANLDTCTGNLDNTANNALDGPCAGENHVTYQGHNYGIIEIGDQCWFSENLDVEWFRDGSPIAHLQGTSEWLTTDAAGWCYPEDASGNALETLGRLYNFWVVGNNICPSGWHIPNFAEWFQDGNLKPWYEAQHPANEGITGGAMKVPGTQDWIAPNSGATNELGWNGRPSGSRDLDGQFSPVGTIATYHINNTFGGGEAHHTVLSTGSTDLYRISPWRGDAPETWHMGTAIRCVKN